MPLYLQDITVGTLGTNMFSDLLAFHGLSTSSIGAGEYLLFTNHIMNRALIIRALLSTILAGVISIGTIPLQMLDQVSPHEVFDFIAAVFAFLWAWNQSKLAGVLLQCTNGPLPLAPPVHMTASDTKSFDLSLT